MVEDIGEATLSIPEQLPGSGPLYAKGTIGPGNVGSGVSDGGKYVPGTTWVFDDDKAEHKRGNDMSVDDFANKFDQVRKHYHYYSHWVFYINFLFHSIRLRGVRNTGKNSFNRYVPK